MKIMSTAESKKEAFLSVFLRKHIKDPAHVKRFEDDLAYKTQPLDNSVRKPRKKTALKSTTCRQRNNLKLFDLKSCNHRYENYIPLHQLWLDYFQDIIDFSKLKPENQQQFSDQLLKADYHGAIVVVSQSKCPSLIGKTGIILQETKNVFKIITTEHDIKVLPKQNSIFAVEVNGHLLNIYGNNFLFRPSERSVRKFKTKPSIDL